jgi:hypothetical protein
MTMPHVDDRSPFEAGAEADVVEQQASIDEEVTVDISYLNARRDAEVNSADLFEQAIEVPFDDDERA